MCYWKLIGLNILVQLVYICGTSSQSAYLISQIFYLIVMFIDMVFYDEHCRSPLVGSSTPVSSSFPPEVLDSAQISSNSQPHVKSQGKLTRK